MDILRVDRLARGSYASIYVGKFGANYGETIQHFFLVN